MVRVCLQSAASFALAQGRRATTVVVISGDAVVRGYDGVARQDLRPGDVTCIAPRSQTVLRAAPGSGVVRLLVLGADMLPALRAAA